MRLHILGVCGTFMSGVALLAKESGHQVTGSDENIYPPMSHQLHEQGITLFSGFDPGIIDNSIDYVIVGNVIKRGNPALEYVLNQQIPYLSGPEWLAQHILKNRWVLGVAGTHGKTTTTSLLAWILAQAGCSPGFLVGGIPENFGISASLGKPPFFVIEADEYDSAFFDKRAKFIHYRAKTVILNNLEYDHADIFPDLAAVKQQFHHLIKTIPGNGRIIYREGDVNLINTLRMGCWTPQVTFGVKKAIWHAELIKKDGSVFNVFYRNDLVGEVKWQLLGDHNVYNALAAIAAAYHINISPEIALRALPTFKNVKRRLEIKGKAKDITIYDDFAHHPTAIATTLAGLRARIGKQGRLIAVLEFGSYTMRAGVHKHSMKQALAQADMVVCKNTAVDWGLANLLAQFDQPTALYEDVDSLIRHLVPQLKAGDHVVVMSNSSFGGIHSKLIQAIETGMTQ